MKDLLLKLLIRAKDEVTGPVGKIWRGINRGAKRARAEVRSVSDRFVNLKTAILAAAASLGLWQAASSAIDSAAGYEALLAQLEALEGSAEKAQARIQALEGAFSPAFVAQATEAYIKLRRFGLEATTDQIQALINQNAKLGGSQENLNGIILQLGQAWGKQKLQYEDILVLQERGVPVFELLAAATGKNVQELTELASAGKLGRDAISALIAEMGRTSQGAAAKGLKLWNGLVQTFMAHWARLQRTILGGGLFDYLKEKIREATDVLEYFVESGAAKEWGEQVADAAINAGNWVNNLLKFLKTSLGGIGGIFSFVTGSIHALAAGISAILSDAFFWLEKLLGAFGANRWSKAAKDLSDAMRAAFEDNTKNLKIDVDDVLDAWKNMTDEVDNSTTSWDELVRNARNFKTEAAAAKDPVAAIGTEAEVAGAKLGTALESGAKKGADALRNYVQSVKAVRDEFSGLERSLDNTASKADNVRRIDISSGITAAQNAIAGGDFSGALESSREMAEMLKALIARRKEYDALLAKAQAGEITEKETARMQELRNAGLSTTTVLKDTARQLTELATDAAEGEAKVNLVDADNEKDEIAKLKAAAEEENITIPTEFNVEGAIEKAQAAVSGKTIKVGVEFVVVGGAQQFPPGTLGASVPGEAEVDATQNAIVEAARAMGRKL